MPEIELSQGIVRYRDEGLGPTIVLIHGLLVDGSIWDRVVPIVSRTARCIVPDLPLGSHRIAMQPGADLTPPGLARIIVELLERLELDDVTLVGNDTGGALCQLVAADYPERVSRLMLTNCDAFEHFPPPSFALAMRALGRGPGVAAAIGTLGRVRLARRALFGMARLTIEPIPDQFLSRWVAPLRDRGTRRDLVKVAHAISSEYTLKAAERLRRFDRPAVIAWGRGDVFFPRADAQRLAATLPNARLAWIDGARTFVQLDAPERIAGLVGELASAPATAPN